MSRIPMPKSGWDKENVQVIRDLEDLGWTFTRGGNAQAVHGRSPDGTETVSIHSRAGNRKKYEALVRKWRQKAAEAAKPQAAAFVAVTDALSDPEEGPVDPILDAVLLKAADKHLREVMDVVAVHDPELTVVSERPWLSRMSSSRAKATTKPVESDRVTEVTFSDGSKQWRCDFPGCGYVTDKSGRSASHHFGQAHTKKGQAPLRDASARVPVAENVPIDPASMLPEHHYSPSERLHRALSAFLAEAGTSDVEALAYAALQWFHTRPDLEPAEDRPHRDLTSDEVLDRVRLLVGGRDVALEAPHEALMAEAEQLRGEVTRLRDTLATLGDLARSEVQH